MNDPEEIKIDAETVVADRLLEEVYYPANSEKLPLLLGLMRQTEGERVLVFANKQDLPNAMEVSEMADKLGLGSMRNRKWYIKGCCATTGDGLYDGLDWMNKTLNE